MSKPTIPIRAAVIGRDHPGFGIEHVEIDAPRDDELLVRLAACGICHTDLDFASDVSTPTIFGHEGSGVVEAVGRDVEGFAVGDHVLLSYASCGECGACLGDAPYDCDSFWELNFGFRRFDGSSAYEHAGIRGHFFGQSAFATHTLVTPRNAVKIDATLPLDVLAPLGCGLQTGAGTPLHVFAMAPGASLAIFGVGAVGLGALMAARNLGATTLVAIDRLPQRLALARELGATHVLDAEREGDLVQALRRCVAAGFDYAIDTSGSAAVATTMRNTIAPHGRCAFLAGGDIIQGNSIPQHFIPQMVEWYRQGVFPLERLICRYPLADIARACEDARAGRVIKAVVTMPDE